MMRKDFSSLVTWQGKQKKQKNIRRKQKQTTHRKHCNAIGRVNLFIFLIYNTHRILSPRNYRALAMKFQTKQNNSNELKSRVCINHPIALRARGMLFYSFNACTPDHFRPIYTQNGRLKSHTPLH